MAIQKSFRGGGVRHRLRVYVDHKINLNESPLILYSVVYGITRLFTGAGEVDNEIELTVIEIKGENNKYW